MKKLLKSLLAVMLVAITAFSLASCGVNTDPVKAAENLSAKGYEVATLHDDGSLIAGTAAQAGIEMAVAGFGVSASDVDYIVSGGKESEADYETIVIYYCKTDDAANKIYESYKGLYDELKKQIETAKEEAKTLTGEEKAEAEEAIKELEDSYNDVSYGKSGMVVWVGSKAAVDATR